MQPKKIVVSGCVLALFVIYSFYMRQPGGKTGVATPKTTPDVASSSSTAPTATTRATATYKDGKYIGSVTDAFYGNIQVQATISGGKLTAIDFLQYPNDRPESININQQAMPFLKQEALHAQNARVDSVSGATDTSQAFVESLTVALNKAM